MTVARTPLLLVFKESEGIRDSYGGIGGLITLQAHHLKPETPSDTLVIFMHPMGIMHYLPLPGALAKAGVHVLTATSRYPNNDSALIMEKVAVDLGKWVAHAREKLGYARIILAGWSGGGSLALLYQAEAADPQITHTPAGDAFDMKAAALPPIDGIMLLAAHVSRAEILTEWLDASVIDEANPGARDPKLNLYGPAAPQPPYTQDFLSLYAAAQRARTRRITAWAKATLADITARHGPHAERAFIVHGTMAAPCWLDPTIDPNDRTPGRCYLGDPRAINDAPGGLARFSTLRSWLSQWSLASHARLSNVAPRIQVPVLIISNTADDACTPSHAARLHKAVENAASRTLHHIEGATHYYAFQPHHLEAATTHIKHWLTT
jgi:pimeloyl-ACP methyl ester carboxylesterase